MDPSPSQTAAPRPLPHLPAAAPAAPGAPPSARLRGQVLQALRAAPGSTASDLARALGVHHSSAAYHLDRLERRGLVALLRHRGRVHAFLAADHGPRDRAQAVLARCPGSVLVLDRVGPSPARLGAVAAGLPMTKAAVYWHLVRLAALGLVAIEGPPKARTYRRPVQPVAPGFNRGPVPA